MSYLLAGYCVPMLLGFRWVWRDVWDECPNDPPTWGDFPLGVFFVAVLLLFWPLTALYCLAPDAATVVRAIGGESREQRRKRAAEKTAQLEKELGIS